MITNLLYFELQDFLQKLKHKKLKQLEVYQNQKKYIIAKLNFSKITMKINGLLCSCSVYILLKA